LFTKRDGYQMDMSMTPEPQKPLSQAEPVASAEVGSRIPEVGREAGTRVNEGVAVPNPIRGGAFEEREKRKAYLRLTHGNLVHGLVTGTVEVEQLLKWTGALSPMDFDLLVESEVEAAKAATARAGG
jgi:hypothetical protein